jgi:hypothetical protein
VSEGEAGPAGPSSRARTWLVPAVVAASFAFGAIRLLAYVHRYAVDIFFWDEWDYFSGLFNGASEWQLFARQHGPHRMGLGMWLMQAILELSHWNARAVAFAAAILYVLAALFALVLKRRIAGPLTIFDAAIPLLFLQLGHYETWVGATNLSHGPLPLLMVVLFALSLTWRGDWSRALPATALACAATATGFALFLPLVAVPVFAVIALRAERRAPWILGIACAIASLSAFFVNYRFMPAVDCFVFPAPHPLDYLRFLGLFLGHAAGLPPLAGAWEWGFIGVAVASLAFGAAALALSWREPSPFWCAVAALQGFALLFGLNSAVGRVCLGTGSAVASRYVPYAISGCFAVYLALSRLRGPAWLRPAALTLALACAAAASFPGRNRGGIAYLSSAKAGWRACYLRTHDLEGCQKAGELPIYPRPAATGLQQKLDYLEQRRLNLFTP